jgi:hypothetical protein
MAVQFHKGAPRKDLDFEPCPYCTRPLPARFVVRDEDVAMSPVPEDRPPPVRYDSAHPLFPEMQISIPRTVLDRDEHAAKKPCSGCGQETNRDPYRSKIADGVYLCELCQLEAWDRKIERRLVIQKWLRRFVLSFALCAIAVSAVFAAKVVTDASAKRATQQQQRH